MFSSALQWLTEHHAALIGGFMIVLWLLWSLFSETRYRHGFWVAFLLPLSPLLFPILWLIYQGVKYGSLGYFMLRGRRAEHAEFMRQFEIRSGVFLLF